MLTRKAKLLLSLTVATPLLFAACVDNTLTGVYGDVAGTYSLTVFAGKTLPATYTYAAGDISSLPNGGTITWTDGTMVLNSLGTFTETNYYVVTPTGGSGQNGTFVSSGTFTVSGNTFQLSAQAQNGIGPRSASGTIQLNTINYDEQNQDGTTSAYEYKR
jgi:predicted small secreted protein